MSIASILSRKRLALLAGVALIASGPGAAEAQDQPAGTELVVVTGTRIPRPQYDLPNPTVSVSSQDIENSGVTNLSDYIQRIPALTGSFGQVATSGFNTPASADGSSLGGLNLLDLRNLGYVRTLVLVDGHRHVAQSTGSSAIDIQTIPITLVDRIDVSTGGASAIYGADAVSGVVNFVMKHDLEGIKATVQGGASQDGGGNSYLTAASVGHNFDDGAGNVTATFEGAYQDRLFFTQRSFTRVGGATFFVPNPNAGALGAPNFIPTNDAQFIFSAPTGAIDTDLDFLPDHLGNGQVFNLGTPISNSTAIGSSGQPFANVLQGDFLPTSRRYIGQLDGDYSFSRYFKVSAEFKYAHVDTKSFSTPPFDDFTAILPDNAFLPANVASLIAANGAGFGILSEDYLALRRAEEVKRNIYRSVLDVSGDVPFWNDTIDNFHYDLSYVYGQSDIDDIDVGNRVEDRFFSALDSVIDPATGKPTCRSNLNPAAAPPDTFALLGFGSAFTDTDFFDPANWPATFTPGPNSGCVAFNPFDPNASQKAAIAFITHNTHVFGVIMQHVVNGYVSGDFDQFKNWGLDGPLSLVLGGEYRKESSASTPDAFTQQSLTFDSGTQPVRGSFDVKEFFAEANLPVLLNRPFAKELSFDAAVRQSSYSTAGDSTSWKFGGIFSPVDGLKFRATEAVAVRAPNIGELFAPQQRLFSQVNDPCSAANVFGGTGFRVPNCVAIQAALGLPYTPGVTNLDTGATIPTLVGGNPLLTPEDARTVTAGIVVQPPGKNWVATLDYYDITIRNAILAPSGQSVADECVDLSTINNPFCALITRTSGGGFPGSISQINVTQLNVASFETDGFDFDVTYHTELKDWINENAGSLDFHLIGNYLDKLTFTALPGQAPVESANTIAGGIDGLPAPRWQTNLDIVWNWDQWNVDYNIDWYSPVLSISRQTHEAQPNQVAPQFLYVPDHFEQNVQVAYTVDDGWTIYGGINNLFYQKPSIGQQFYPVSPLGRFFYAGLRVNTGLPDIDL